MVDVFARRFQVQERLTTQIKECIQNTLNVVTASAEELGSPYACPVYRPGGVMDPVTDDDARLLLTRVVGVASGTPFRSGDDGHYTLVCTGGD